MGIGRQIFINSVVVVPLLILCLAFLPGPLLPNLEPEAYKLEAPAIDGELAPNNKLDSTEKIFENRVINPECIDVWKGDLYTGLEDGRIVRLKDDKVETVVRVGGVNCDKTPSGCGRPNGLRFDDKGSLVVADPARGVYRVNVNTGEITSLYSITDKVDDKFAHPNHPDVGKNGDVYFSDMSSKWDMHFNFYSHLEHSSHGRVLHYDPKTQKTTTLIDGLSFPNGVQLSPEEDFLLVAQSNKNNILKYHLKGAKEGKLETFLDNLPGVPDNIHSTKRGTFWIALVGARLPGSTSLLENLGSYPLLRKVLGRFIYAVEVSLDFLSRHIPHAIFHTLYDKLQVYKWELILGPHHGCVFEVDTNGRIIRSLQSPSGHIYHISHVLEYENYLYLGTPFHPVIGKYKLNS